MRRHALTAADYERVRGALADAGLSRDFFAGDDIDALYNRTHGDIDRMVTVALRMACAHDWQEQPGEPPVDACSKCGATRR